MSLPFILLQAGGNQPQGGFPFQILFFIGILAIFYFFMIRPQQKRQKEERKFRENLSKGDQIVTIGGIYGKVVKLDETSAVVEVDENVKIKFDKSSLRPPTAQTSPAKS